MSLFGKIKYAVMGNPVTREYEIGKHVASAGPGLLWKVYNGVKKSTRQEVSIFIYDKKSAEAEKIPKKHREGVLIMLRKGPTQLIRLRHPRLLIMEHQLEESNDTLAFVTEPVVASIANAIGRYDNLPTPLPLAMKEFELHAVEIQYGILQLSEALEFLHSSVKMLHGNMNPDSVVITAQGAWKLMGFNFSSYSQYQSEAQVSFAFREWDTRGFILTNPSLDYLAPEYILNKTCSQASDIFSFGMLCYAVYNEGRSLLSTNNNILTFKHNAEQISRMTETALAKVPAGFKHTVRSMLAIEPTVRPDALQITKNEFFEEAGVSTLKYLDMLFERSDMEKSQFFKKNLARTMRLLPKRVVRQRVLPALAGEFRNHRMIPFLLPLVLLIAEDCAMQEYASLVMPVLTPAFKIQKPVQVPLILLQKMDLILKKTPQDDMRAHILPMIITSLEAEHGQLQELCVTILPTFASMIDYSSMKHSIIPRVTAVCLSSREPSLVIKCLVCIGQMLDILDKHIVLDVVLPTLENVSLREPGVLMGILGIFHETLKNKKLGIDKTMLATRVIPFLLPLSIEPALNLKQFNQFMMVIREMLVKMESEHHVYLEQLSKMEEQTKSTVDFAREVAEQKAMDDAIDRIENIFGDVEKSPQVAARKGSSIPISSSVSASSGLGASKDLLAGLSVGDIAVTISNKSSSSPSMTSNHKLERSTSKVTNFGNQSQPLTTWETPPSRSLEALKPVSSTLSTSSYIPPRTAATSAMYDPKQPTGLSGSPAPLHTSKSSLNSLFPKMQVSQPAQTGILQPTNINVHGAPETTTSYPHQSNTLQASMFSGMQVNPGMAQQQPLTPAPATNPNLNPMGWSSSVGTTNPNHNPMGWSVPVGGNSLLNPTPTPANNSGTSWSSTRGMQHQSGMEQYNSRLTTQLQPSMSAELQTAGTGVSQNWSPVQQSPMATCNQRNTSTSGSNPFADLSFLG